VTKAALPGGELAGGGSENGYAALVAPISGWCKVFCDGNKADSAKVFASGENLHLKMEPMAGIAQLRSPQAPQNQMPMASLMP
jgi:hypothetical protein